MKSSQFSRIGQLAVLTAALLGGCRGGTNLEKTVDSSGQLPAVPAQKSEPTSSKLAEPAESQKYPVKITKETLSDGRVVYRLQIDQDTLESGSYNVFTCTGTSEQDVCSQKVLDYEPGWELVIAQDYDPEVHGK